ncbi:MAG: iron-siderophore ABC transporter substrate-binding protein, partial [Stackebrandtia sp.]
DWKDVTTTIGKAMGEEKQARKLLGKTEKLIAGTAKDNPQFADVKFAYGWTLPEKSTEMPLYVKTDPRVQLIQQLGFTLSPQIADVDADPGTFNTNVSLEEIDTIDADVYIGWANSKADIDRTVNNRVLKEWKPFASDAYYVIEDMGVGWASSAPTVLGIPWVMDELVKGLDGAVAGKE